MTRDRTLLTLAGTSTHTHKNPEPGPVELGCRLWLR